MAESSTPMPNGRTLDEVINLDFPETGPITEEIRRAHVERMIQKRVLAPEYLQIYEKEIAGKEPKSKIYTFFSGLSDMFGIRYNFSVQEELVKPLH